MKELVEQTGWKLFEVHHRMAFGAGKIIVILSQRVAGGATPPYKSRSSATRYIVVIYCCKTGHSGCEQVILSRVGGSSESKPRAYSSGGTRNGGRDSGRRDDGHARCL